MNKETGELKIMAIKSKECSDINSRPALVFQYSEGTNGNTPFEIPPEMILYVTIPSVVAIAVAVVILQRRSLIKKYR